ncbi:hypothetical protein LJB42_001937 [Komagataella kurtzmanii]|nr:hypothetical protein LJB42_001937 [Komagataella kurtzmanii]
MSNVQSFVNSSSEHMEGVKFQQVPGGSNFLTSECLTLLTDLHRNFNARRKLLLQDFMSLHQERYRGVLPTFSEESLILRQDDWKHEKATDLENLLESSPANGSLDGNVVSMNNIVLPIWENSLKIQALLHQKIKEGRDMIIEPRGLNYNEKSLMIDGEPVSGALLDFAIFYFKSFPLVDKVTFYISSLSSRNEASFWRDVFEFTQHYYKTEINTILCIDSLDSLFHIEEILQQLKLFVVGLHHNKYKYMNSFISTTGEVLAQESQLTYNTPLLFYYISMLKNVSQRRQIKLFNDPLLNLKTPNYISEDDLLNGEILGGCITESALRSNIQLCMEELNLWWNKVPLNLSRVEFLRALLNQWINKKAYFNNGVQLSSGDTQKLVRQYSIGQYDVDNMMSPNLLSLSLEDYVTLKTYGSTIPINIHQQKL